MSNLVQALLSIKSPYNNFIERPELIQGYTEDEIKQIELKYDFPIHGQFKELLMTMGKCSGGILRGDDIYIYRETLNYDDFHNELNIEIQNDPDCQEFIKNMGDIDLVEKNTLLLQELMNTCFSILCFLQIKTTLSMNGILMKILLGNSAPYLIF